MAGQWSSSRVVEQTEAQGSSHQETTSPPEAQSSQTQVDVYAFPVYPCGIVANLWQILQLLVTSERNRLQCLLH